MKVLDLSCDNRHLFEGWFQSEDDFAEQCRTGVLVCPVCESPEVHKRLSAPRLNLGKGLATVPAVSPPLPSVPPAEAAPVAAHELAHQKAWLTALRTLIAQSDDVGPRFADEARRMHQGDIESRSIHGQATWAEAVELLEEGVAILPLPDLPGVKTPLQ
jgi:hypothetical protein